MPIQISRALITALALGLTACSSTQNPVTGQREFTTISREQEQKIGDEQHPELVESFGGAVTDGRITGYINNIGQRLAAHSHLAGQQRFTFTVLDSPQVNAFAVPGGYVYITRGLMALAQDEAQLAGVIGHEIGHVTGRHTAQRQTRSTIAGVGALAATLGAAALGADGSTLKTINQLAGTAAKGSVAQFSQSQELEADTLGVEYISKAGYDPFALGEFLDVMKAQEALHARLKGRSYDPNSVSFFATHPATGARVTQAVNAAQASGLPINSGAPRNQESYMRVIDGMYYGDSPQQGYTRSGTFWHPELGFAFTAPNGWEIKNAAKAVGIVAPNGKAMAVLDASNTRGKPIDQILAEALKKAQNATRPERLTINGLPAVTATATGTSKGKKMRMRVVLIDMGGGKTYRFRMISEAGRFSQNDRAFEALARSFRRISRHEAPQPLRIRTRQVRPGESAASLAAQTAFDNEKEARFRVMNGLGARQEPRPGQWVKLVQ